VFLSLIVTINLKMLSQFSSITEVLIYLAGKTGVLCCALSICLVLLLKANILYAAIFLIRGAKSTPIK
jgi:hypothetical protein